MGKTIKHNLPWTPREQHSGMFLDGDAYLVAVPLHGGGHDYSIIIAQCDEEYFDFHDKDGNSWHEWSWDDVSHYINLRETSPPDDACSSMPDPDAEIARLKRIEEAAREIGGPDGDGPYRMVRNDELAALQAALNGDGTNEQ